MNLHRAAKGEYKAIKALYISAFPRDERAPFFFLKRRARQNRAEMLVAEEKGGFIGFVYAVSRKDLIYLFYFAVAEDMRGSGNGSAILRALKVYYEGKRIFLAREPLDDRAENNRERIRRRDFYIQNDFIDLPHQVQEGNICYDLMSTGEEISAQDYNTLIRDWTGGFRLRFVTMKFVE